METGGGGLLGRVGEKVLTWIAAALLLVLAVAVYRMDAGTREAILRGIGRTLVWVVVSGALPWVTRLFIARLLEVGSNWAGAILIAGLTLINALLGLFLMGGWPSGGWAWLATLAALAVVGTYNYLVAEYLAERAGG